MALSLEDKQEILEMLQSTRCSCGLSHETQEEVGHFFGRLKDLGKGNLNQGVEDFSAALRTIGAWRKLGERVGGTVTVFVCVSIATGMVAIVAAGVKFFIKKVAGE